MRFSIRIIFGPLAVLLAIAAVSVVASAQETNEPTVRSGYVMTSDGVKIHYLDASPVSGAADAPSLLFIPGWTMPAEIWEKQIAYFSRTRRVVAIDPRSQGLSSQTTDGNYPEARARDIKAVVDELKLAPVVLVGWSMGVGEVIAYADQFGCDSIAGLVLVDGFAGSSMNPQTKLTILNFAGAIERNREKSALAFVRSMYKTPQSDAYLERITQASLKTPTNTAMALMVGMLTGDRQPALAKITKPTLIIGADSPFAGAYTEMQKSIPGSRLEIFKNVGHALFVDDADRFNRTVEEFLKTSGK